MEATDLDQVMNCFSLFASAHNGPVQSPDRDWWHDHVLAPKSDRDLPRAVVVPNGEGLAGYASYHLEPWGPGGFGDNSYKAVCNHLVFEDARALRALLGYFRGFENSASELAWYGPPSTSPVALAIGSNGFSMKSDLTRWMTRVLDVPLALRSRGYPQATGEAVVEIDDTLFPENAGPWLVQADAGRVSVEPVDRAAAARDRSERERESRCRSGCSLRSIRVSRLPPISLSWGLSTRTTSGCRSCRRCSPAPFPGCRTSFRQAPRCEALGGSLGRAVVGASDRAVVGASGRAAPSSSEPSTGSIGAGKGSRCTIASRRVQRVRAT